MPNYSSILGDGDWNSASMWLPLGGPPTPVDSATVSVTGSDYTVTVTTSEAANSLNLSSANATINDDGAGALLSVGIGGLRISAGTFERRQTSVASGVLTVNGPLKSLRRRTDGKCRRTTDFSAGPSVRQAGLDPERRNDRGRSHHVDRRSADTGERHSERGGLRRAAEPDLIDDAAAHPSHQWCDRSRFFRIGPRHDQRHGLLFRTFF